MISSTGGASSGTLKEDSLFFDADTMDKRPLEDDVLACSIEVSSAEEYPSFSLETKSSSSGSNLKRNSKSSPLKILSG